MSDEVCNDYQQVQLGKYAATDLRCQKYSGHSGKHAVSRWFGIVYMTAEWS